MLIKQNAKKGFKKIAESLHSMPIKKNSGDQEIQALIPRKIQLLQWFFPRKKSEESDHSSACTISSHVHHMSHDRAVHGYFLTVWWPEVIVFVTPKMGSTSNTKYSSHQFATQSLGKMKFPHLLPPKNTPPKSCEHFQPAGNAADPPIGWTVSRCQYLCTWKVFLPNFTKWLQ